MATLPSSALCLYHFDADMNDALGAATVTNHGAALSTTQKKFGTNSLYFNGTSSSGSWLDIALPSSNVYTVAMWVYRTSANTAGWMPYIYSTSQALSYGGISNSVDYQEYSIYACAGARGTDNSIADGNFTTEITTNTWHHLAYTRNGSTFKFYLDGVLQVTITQDYPPTVTHLYLGGLMYGGGILTTSYFQGYIDEMFVASEAIWTANFTPPADAYVTPSTYDTKRFFNSQYKKCCGGM